MYDVAVVIVNYKMKADIERCLASLFADLVSDPLSVKVVVVDNASGDDIKEFLQEKFPSVACLRQETNSGFGAAQNVGLRSVEAKYYFALNPDTYFFPGRRLVRRLFDYMEAHPKIGVLGPKIVYPDGTLQYSCYRFPTFWQPIFSRTHFGQEGRGKKVNDVALMKDFDHKKTRPVDWVMGSAMFVRGAAVRQVGWFDERFWMYYEDSDWCRRMWEAGWPVYYAHDMLLEHVHGRGSAKVPGIFKALIKNKLARVHLVSWLKYMWKWRGNYKYYGTRP
ncbi:MAG: glycosyltransferase family 2 protein [Candidatus Magasanikbacteria bacterium]|nr:glycosyltransferase family 2 protein [Candidatus Magasanikbacteria bacterium]